MQYSSVQLCHLPIEEAGCYSALSISFQRPTAPLPLPRILGFNDYILDARSFKSTHSFGMQARSTRLPQAWREILVAGDQSKFKKGFTGNSEIRRVKG